MKYVYGPVPSRRLGNSLGIDPLPSKTCNYQCIYCQLGKTNNFTNIRKNYFPKKDTLTEIEKAIKLNENKFDYITFVGSGEPTLYKDLKDLIIKAKELSEKPVCVITNGSLLYEKEVQNALISSDVVLPSLDAGDETSFIKINRPHPSISFDNLIKGFIDFRKIFKGKFWIEVMLMKGINDTKEELLKIKEKLDLIKPDRIDINVPIRPPVEKWVKIPDKNIISLLNAIFGDYTNIFFPEEGTFKIYSSNFENEILSILKRHPMRQKQIIETFSSSGFSKNVVISNLKKLKSENKIKEISYNKQIFWKINI
ncbi:MAG: radical SAM protein [Promethearchaeota archaeon Loki_b32]|nr:MAG: radical SAM protein [Candidatus Lokiarchaeota archaeon Loki_b32]